MSNKCRATYCGMSFHKADIRNQHESLMHKDMFKNAANQMLDLVIQKASPIDLSQKKVYNGGIEYSYNEIKNMDRNSEEFNAINQLFGSFIDTWLNNNPNTTIDDFFRTAQFEFKERK